MVATDPDQIGAIHNTAEVTGNELDPTATNNNASEETACANPYLIFADGFESGNAAAWSTSTGATRAKA